MNKDIVRYQQEREERDARCQNNEYVTQQAVLYKGMQGPSIQEKQVGNLFPTS